MAETNETGALSDMVDIATIGVTILLIAHG
jgi:hypothetical protein